MQPPFSPKRTRASSYEHVSFSSPTKQTTTIRPTGIAPRPNTAGRARDGRGCKKGSVLRLVPAVKDANVRVLEWRRKVFPPGTAVLAEAVRMGGGDGRKGRVTKMPAAGQGAVGPSTTRSGATHIPSSAKSQWSTRADDDDDGDDGGAPTSEGSVIAYSPSPSRSPTPSRALLPLPSTASRSSSPAPAPVAAPPTTPANGRTKVRIKLVGAVQPRSTAAGAAISSPETLIMSTGLAPPAPSPIRPSTSRRPSAPPPAKKTRVHAPAHPTTPAVPRARPSSARPPPTAVVARQRPPFSRRPPSPTESTTSDLIVIEDEPSPPGSSSTPATWCPPEASPTPDKTPSWPAAGAWEFKRPSYVEYDSSVSSSSGSDDDDDGGEDEIDDDDVADKNEKMSDYAPSIGSAEDAAADADDDEYGYGGGGDGGGMLVDPAHGVPDWDPSAVPRAPAADPTPADLLVPNNDEWSRRWSVAPASAPALHHHSQQQQHQQAYYSHAGEHQALFSDHRTVGADHHHSQFGAQQQQQPAFRFQPDGADAYGLAHRAPLGQQQPQQQQPTAEHAVDMDDFIATFSQLIENVAPGPMPSFPSPTDAVDPSPGPGQDAHGPPSAEPEVDAALPAALAEAVQALAAKCARAKEDRLVRADVGRELEALEKGVATVQQRWVALGRTDDDGGGGAEGAGEVERAGCDLGHKLDTIRFWHLTQSALGATVWTAAPIQELLQKYYAPVPRPADDDDAEHAAAAADGRTRVSAQEGAALAHLCLRLYADCSILKTPPAWPFGPDVYAFAHTKPCKTSRDEWNVRLDRVDWPAFEADLVRRARAVVAHNDVVGGGGSEPAHALAPSSPDPPPPSTQAFASASGSSAAGVGAQDNVSAFANSFTSTAAAAQPSSLYVAPGPSSLALLDADMAELLNGWDTGGFWWEIASSTSTAAPADARLFRAHPHDYARLEPHADPIGPSPFQPSSVDQMHALPAMLSNHGPSSDLGGSLLDD